jgi:5-methylcytosine-specific restriction protein A
MAWSTESRHDRGYGTRWNKIRKQVLARDCGMCQCSDCAGRKKVATHVHHKVSKASAKQRGWPEHLIDDVANLVSLSEECHDKMHKHTPKPSIGADGWPVDPKSH